MESTNEAVSRQPNRRKPERADSARASILLAIILTVANIVLLFIEADYFFLFSAEIPYFFVLRGYEFILEASAGEALACYVVAAAFLLLLLLCWHLSKKQPGWLAAAAVLFVLDTAALLLLYEFESSIVDYVFHAWILFELIRGTAAAFKGKKPAGEPQEPWADDAAQAGEAGEEAIPSHDTPLYMADMETKQRVFLECEASGMHILYRRVKHTNELIVNGRVYDTIEGIVEFPHTLYAQVNGHRIEASYAASNHTYITVDGEVLGKKLRLW